MKKLLWLFIICAVFIITFILPVLTHAENSIQEETWRKKFFTYEELKKYDGKAGRPAYVAVDGIVYDVTNSPHWKKGTHKGMHQAGGDLTSDFKNKAPKKIHHDGKVLERMPKVGVIKTVEEKSAAQTLKSDTTTAATPSALPPVMDYKVEPSAYGRTVSCPVTKEKFKINKNTPALKYKDKVYYFCCPACIDDFKKDPEKYTR